MEVKITGDVYAQSKEEFKAIKLEALRLGYKGKEMTSYPENKATGVGQFLVMKEPNFVRKGKCGFCNSLIDVLGIYGHNRKCEVCKKTISKSYCPGDLITFFFRNNNSVFDDITLRIHSMDEGSKIMRFDSVIPREGKYRKQNKKKVLETLSKNKDSYTETKIGKKKVYSFYYPFNGMMNELTKINTSETRNRTGSGRAGFQYCSVVNIMFGKEYSEYASYSGMFNELPMPETFHIYRDWKVEKTIHEMIRRSGFNSRPEYYSGRPPGDITSNHLGKLNDLIKTHKGQEASTNFIKMIGATNDMSATSLIKRILKLDSLNYKWNSSLDEAQKQDDFVELDGTAVQALGTFMSMASKSGLGFLFNGETENVYKEILDGVNDRVQYSRSNSIKTEFINSIK